jgi:hypothetical protein
MYKSGTLYPRMFSENDQSQNGTTRGPGHKDPRNSFFKTNNPRNFHSFSVKFDFPVIFLYNISVKNKTGAYVRPISTSWTYTYNIHK